MAESVINWTCLARLKAAVGAGAAPVLEEVIDAFLEDLPARVIALRRAAADRDPETVHRWAHALKGSSATVGAEALAALFQSIDEARDNPAPLLAELDLAIDQVQRGLAGWREALAL